MRKENDLESWRLLFRVAEVGSVTRAANELGLEPSSVSRRLRALETDLGCDLLQRGARSVALSPIGLSIVEQLKPLLAQWDKVVAEASLQQRSSAGDIRVSAGMGYGHEMLTPMVFKFRQLFPEIGVELVLSDRPADLTRSNFDVVFRYGPVEDASLVARRLYAVDFFVCASPSYLREHGHPQHPIDLSNHVLLMYGGERRPRTTELHCGAERVPVVGQSHVRLNSILSIRDAAINGVGIAIDLPLFSCAQALGKGQLVRVLPKWSPPSRDVYAVWCATRQPPRRLTIFLDWIAAERARARREFLASMGKPAAAPS